MCRSPPIAPFFIIFKRAYVHDFEPLGAYCHVSLLKSSSSFMQLHETKQTRRTLPDSRGIRDNQNIKMRKRNSNIFVVLLVRLLRVLVHSCDRHVYQQLSTQTGTQTFVQ